MNQSTINHETVKFTEPLSVFVFVLYYVLPEWRNKQLLNNY